MKKIDINDIDINNSYFHFTSKENLQVISENGLIPQIGDASQMVEEDSSRVYMSKGGKGILKIKDSFIHKFREIQICNIPKKYQKYFDIHDFSDTNQIEETKLYDALERKFKDEIYLVIDAKEGKDYLLGDTPGFSSEYDIKGKAGHTISSEKIKQLTTQKRRNYI